MAKKPDTTNGEGNTPPINFANIDVPQMMQQRRDQLVAQREDVFNRQQALEQELNTINAELKAIEVFLAVREGRPIPRDEGEKKPRTPRQPREGGAPRAPRGEIRGKVLEAIKEAGPDGLSRADLLEKFGAKGNKSAEQQISNACNALRKSQQVDNRDGRWVAP